MQKHIRNTFLQKKKEKEAGQQAKIKQSAANDDEHTTKTEPIA